MGTVTPTASAVHDYSRIPTAQLAHFISEDGDAEALYEMLRRQFWRTANGRMVTIPEYIDTLSRRLSERLPSIRMLETIDKARDLTIDKFCNLPRPEEDTPPLESEDDSSKKHPGSNCRHYYRAFARNLHEKLSVEQTQLEHEALAAESLQKLVTRHFFISLAEGRRQSNPYVHRYNWKVNGTSICLIMPRDMSGREKRRWLEKHVNDIDPDNPRERSRIQQFVDEQLNATAPARFGLEYDVRNRAAARPVIPWELAHNVSSEGLAETLANEKAAAITELRPSIQALGQERLRLLILDVFSRHTQNIISDEALAQKHGVSKSTFSRFCGSRWSRNGTEPGNLNVPDLWKNLAGLLARFPKFEDAARAACVWNDVQTVIRGSRLTVERSGANE